MTIGDDGTPVARSRRTSARPWSSTTVCAVSRRRSVALVRPSSVSRRAASFARASIANGSMSGGGAGGAATPPPRGSGSAAGAERSRCSGGAGAPAATVASSDASVRSSRSRSRRRRSRSPSDSRTSRCSPSPVMIGERYPPGQRASRPRQLQPSRGGYVPLCERYPPRPRVWAWSARFVADLDRSASDIRHAASFQPPRISTAISATSVGVRPTRTPLASSASAFATAVPDEPETIAPAWPICLPGGAVKPAM